MSVVPSQHFKPSSSSDELATQRQRSIFHWHRSTILIVMCLVACLLLIEVPGQTCNGYYFRDFYLQEHGWPFVHLKRFVQRPSTSDEELALVRDYLKEIEANDLSNPSDAQPGSAFWSDANNWRVFSAYGVWYRWSFVANLSICVATCFVFGGLFEWRRRHRKSVLQFTLTELLLAVALGTNLIGLTGNSQPFHARRFVKIKCMADQLGLDWTSTHLLVCGPQRRPAPVYLAEQSACKPKDE